LRKEEDERIKKARYNTRYKEFKALEGCSRYLKTENLEEIGKGEEIRALVKLRCGNLENANKYWLNKELWKCVFCEKKKDSLEHYVKECSEVKVWFREMGSEDAEIVKQLWGEDLDSCKGKLLRRLVKERRKRPKIKEKKRR